MGIRKCNCGNTPEIVLYGCFSDISEMAGISKTNMYYGLKCYSCGTQTKRHIDKDNAIEEWNSIKNIA